jgi:concentrative nucleoside transporter, CNT family
MEILRSCLGILVILGLAFALSRNRKAINYRLVGMGLLIQVVIGSLVLKVKPITEFFRMIGEGMKQLEGYASQGAAFVFGNTMVNSGDGTGAKPFGAPATFVFAFNITATIILVCILVAMLYHIGLMQRVVSVIARGVHYVMGASGSETLSNVASAFVGQVEAQVMIRPYLKGMTNSELLASMAGSMACIAGGILVVYVNMGVPAEYLIAASIMAAPGALVIAKIIYPETEVSETSGVVSLKVKSPYTNLIDAISHGASDGMKISINVIAMLIGFIALIAMINALIGLIDPNYSLDKFFGVIFYPLAWVMGVPENEVKQVATLMGQKLTINEFVAYSNLIPLKPILSAKGLAIASIALCGFANFSSVGIQIGGIGELAPERRADLSRLGMWALLCGTLASYLSATIAGILSSF